MFNKSNFGPFFFLFISYCIVNISSKNNPISFDMLGDINDSEFKPLYFNSNDKHNLTLVPSLFSPMTLFKFAEYENTKYQHYDIAIIGPLFGEERKFKVYSAQFTYNNLKMLVGIEKMTSMDNNYFGLSFELPIFTDKEQYPFNTLEYLKNTSQIGEKVFSFNKWEINENQIKSKLYLGYSHEDFDKKNKKYIGTCQNVKGKDIYWGCYFTKMIFNKINIPLNNSEAEDNSKLFKIVFSSEQYTIIFPMLYKILFEEASKGICEYNTIKKAFVCKGVFEEDSIPLTLTNDNMDITLEIDSLSRFSHNTEFKKGQFKIAFQEIDYIIFPLIMFKQFHIQFNADKNIVKFYSTDEKILKVKIEEEEESNIGTILLIIFLIIIIILVLLALAYGVHYFIKKRRGGVERQIGKFSKIEMTGKNDE